MDTLVINMLGCLLFAWFLTIVTIGKKNNKNLILAIGTGFIGSFTTFSAFSVETLNLLKNEQSFIAIIYVLMSIFGGIGMSLIGFKLATLKFKSKRETK